MEARPNGGADNPLVSLAVGALTEGLRLAGVGANEYRAATAAADSPAASGGRRLRRGDVAGLLRTLRRDFANSYFVTGVLDNAEIYSPHCLFADPTISFRGRDLYIRNLSLLVPFLVEPRIELKSLRRLKNQPRQRWQWPTLLPGSRQSSSSGGRNSSSGGSGGSGGSGSSGSSGSEGSASAGRTQLFAEWRLTCYVRLPWAPFVEVNGTTTYTLDEEENQIVSHVEAWDVSPVQALLLLLKPSERAAWRPQQRAKQQAPQAQRTKQQAPQPQRAQQR